MKKKQSSPFSLRNILIGIGVLVVLVIIFGSASPKSDIRYTCSAHNGLNGLDYGLSGSCVFTNYGDAKGSACVTVNLREGGAIVNEQSFCVNVPSKDSVKKEFFIGMAMTKQYTWDVSNQ